jgi:precorrin-2 dehydrogenase / sirohydrochlorin ferrochelatase
VTPAPLYPVALRLDGRPCLVVGGGRVAARKIADLERCGAVVTVVAPELDPAIRVLAERAEDRVRLEQRPYAAGEAAAYRLVVTATGVPDVDRQAAADAEAAGIWVNSADDPEHCGFFLPSVHRDGPVSVAVSTGGASPALAAWLRRRIGRSLLPGVGVLAGLLEEGRRALREAGRPTGAVDWAGLLDGELPDLVAAGRTAEARRCVEDAVAAATGTAPPH